MVNSGHKENSSRKSQSARRSQERGDRIQRQSARWQAKRIEGLQRRQSVRKRHLSAFKRAGQAFRTWWLKLAGLLTIVVRPIVGKTKGQRSVRRATHADYTSHVPRLATENERLESKALLTATFGPATNFALGATAAFQTGTVLATADFDGDTDLDLVTANYGSNTLSVLTNVSADFADVGSPVQNHSISPDIEPFSVAVGDFNGDGDPDLVATVPNSSNSLKVLLGTNVASDVGFAGASNVTPAGGVAPIGVAVGDFNGDAKLDFVTSNQMGGSITVYLGDGNGGFAAGITNTTPSGTHDYHLAVADFDGDGKPDVATSSQSGHVSVLLNDGLGTGAFIAAVEFNVGGTPYGITTADFDNDGKPDIVTANRTGSSVSVLMNTSTAGTPDFATASSFSVGSTPYSVAAGDFDGDAKLDLVVANSGSNNVSVLHGDGAGSFATAVNFSVGSAPRGVVVGDFNLDTRLDIATANRGTNDVSLLLGQAPPETSVEVSGSNLVVTDINGGTTSDDWTFTADGTNLTITDNNGHPIDILGTIASSTGDGTSVVTIPLSAFTGTLNINSLAGDDVITFGSSFDIGATRGVSVAAGDDTDTATWNATSQLGELEVSAETINLDSGSVDTGIGNQTYNGAVSLGSHTTLTAADVAFNGNIDSGVGGEYSAAVLTDGPVAYWRLGEASGTTAADTGPNSLDGTYNNVTPGQTGAIPGNADTAAAFNGTSSYVEVPDNNLLTLGSEATFEAWINVDSISENFDSIFNKWNQDGSLDEFIFGLTTTNKLRLLFNSTAGQVNVDSVGTISLGTWHHVAAVRDNDTVTFYIDGTAAGSTTGLVSGSSPFQNTVTTLRIGGQGRKGVNRFLDGLIDEPAIYDTALSAAQIAQHAGLITPKSLTINTSGDTTFNGVVGGNNAIESIKVNSTGNTVDVNAAIHVGSGGLDIDPPGTITINAPINSMGPVNLEANDGVTLSGAAADVSISGATFTVDADVNDDGTGTFTTNDSGIAISTAGGEVSITAADVELGGTIDAGVGPVSIAPSDAGAEVLLGETGVRSSSSLAVAVAVGTAEASGVDIASDAAGNTYTVGWYKETATFGTESLTSNGNRDIFITKVDTSGNVVWARSIGGASDSDFARAVAADSSGNVYVTGYFNGTVDFDPSAGGTFNMASTATIDGFVLKLDSNGEFVWAGRIGGNGNVVMYDIALDADNNVYTSLAFGNTVDFDPGPDTHNLSGAVAVSKLDSDGNFVWARHFTGGGQGRAIAVDAGHVYVGGPLGNSTNFDPGGTDFTLSGTLASFTAQLDLDGNFGWATSVDLSAQIDINNLAVDSAGNVYSSGNFLGGGDFDPGTGTTNLTSNGSHDVFVMKQDSAGDFAWAKQFGGGSQELAWGLAVDTSDNVFVAGTFFNTVDFDPNAGTANLTASSTDVFVAKLNSDGEYQAAVKLGGSSSESANDVAVDPNGNVLTTGAFYSNLADFDPGTGTQLLSTAGAGDAFVSKLDNNLTFVTGIAGLALSDAELDNITTTGGIVIGDSSTGDVTVVAPISPDNSDQLTVISGASIADSNAGSTDITVGSLTLDGNIAPGQSPGILEVDGDYAFATGSTFTIEIEGATAGAGHDQLNVAGTSRTVTLNDAQLDITLNAVPAVGSQQAYTILESNGATLSGKFKNGTTTLNDTDTFTVGTTIFRINYTAGDVTLTEAGNTAPVVDLDGSGGTNDFTAAFEEDAGAVLITDTDATIIDAENSELASLKVTVSANPDGADESLTVAGVAFPLNADLTSTGIVGGTTFQVAYVTSTRTFTITKNGGGTAQVGDLQTLLRGITYNNLSNTPNTTARTITITANDGNADSTAAVSSVTVAAVNDAPVRTSGTLTPISVSEDSANSTAVTLGLSTLAYSPIEGSQTLTYTITAIPSFVTVFKIDGSTPVTVGNTVTDVELQGLTYKTMGDANGTGNLTFTVVDNGGNTGPSEDALTENLSMTVAAVNDAPTADSQTITALEDVERTINLTGDDGDPEETQPLTFVLTSLPSTGTLSQTSGGTAIATSNLPLTLEGGELFFITAEHDISHQSFDFKVVDNGSLQSPTATVTVNVTAVNDVPTANAGGPYTILEGADLSLDASNSADIENDSLTFRWDVDGDGDFDENITGEAPTVPWATLVTLGIDDGPDLLRSIRVEASDGIDTGIASSTLSVTNVAPEITSITTDALTLGDTATNDTVTLTAAVSDVAADTFPTVTIHWGDGSSSVGSVSGAGVVSETHVYSVGGIFTVTLSVTDDDGDSNTGTTEAVISGVSVQNNTLNIIGTGIIDQVILQRRSATSYLIRSNTLGTHNVNPADFEAIHIQLGEGNDRFNALGTFEKPLVIDGGAGNDRIVGSRGGDVLLGGPGNDYIWAGSGNNVVVGGSGRDFLFGGSGQDILIAGTTSFDSAPAALRGIHDEWNSGKDLDIRVQNLSNFGGGAGGSGANGTNYLQLATSPSQTVFDDDERDLLFGGGNIDWLFFAPSQDIGYGTIGDLLGDDLEELFRP